MNARCAVGSSLGQSSASHVRAGSNAGKLFGSGIYGSAKGPDEYGSKEAILWNNYRAQIKPGGEWEQMYQDGDR